MLHEGLVGCLQTLELTLTSPFQQGSPHSAVPGSCHPRSQQEERLCGPWDSKPKACARQQVVPQPMGARAAQPPGQMAVPPPGPGAWGVSGAGPTLVSKPRLEWDQLLSACGHFRPAAGLESTSDSSSSFPSSSLGSVFGKWHHSPPRTQPCVLCVTLTPYPNQLACPTHSTRMGRPALGPQPPWCPISPTPTPRPFQRPVLQPG